MLPPKNSASSGLATVKHSQTTKAITGISSAASQPAGNM